MAAAEIATLPVEQHQTLTEISDDEVNLPPSDDEDDAIVAALAAAKKEHSALAAAEGDIDETSDGAAAADADKMDAQVNGVMVLTLLDKIIGAVDQIQQTQSGLEARQQEMERSVTSIQGDLAKLSKSHGTTSNSVNKMLEKVRKVSVNVKTVRANLEKQGGQIKRLESNENELLKRRNFKVMIYQDEVKVPSKVTVSKSMKVSDAVGSTKGSTLELKDLVEEPGVEGEEEVEKPVHVDLSSDEEVEVEETVHETRAERIKRSSLQRVQTLKTVFSKEKMDKQKQKTKDSMEKSKQKTKDNFEKTKENFEKSRQKTKENFEKTKQKTKDNMEKTKQKTKENLEKTRHNIEKKMSKLGTRMSVNPERKEKMKTSREKVKKSFTPEHTVYARAKTAVYKVPPFTFHVKKIREGAVEVQGTEMVEVSQDGEAFSGLEGEVEVEEAGVEMELVNGGGGEEEGMEDEEDEEEDSHDNLLEDEDLELASHERERDSD